MTTRFVRIGRLQTVLRRLGRRLRRTVAAVRGRRPDAPGVIPTHFASNGTVVLAYDVRGQGAPLVLIQGVGLGRWAWQPVADRLARHFQVITIDNRGVGASDAPTGRYSTEAMADDVLAVLDHAGVRTASVLGTSLGGMIAQQLALAHPQRVDKLILVCTVPGGLRSRPMPLGTTYLLASAPFLTSQTRVREFVQRTLGPETLRRQPETARRLADSRLAHPQSEPAWRGQTAAGMLFNPQGRQRQITQPTLILQGSADQVVNPENAHVLAGLIPDARVRLFEGAGHLLYWEQPKRFVRVVTEFLAEPVAPARGIRGGVLRRSRARYRRKSATAMPGWRARQASPKRHNRFQVITRMRPVSPIPAGGAAPARVSRSAGPSGR
jgi:3-oxoadipate enol-lactonase